MLGLEAPSEHNLPRGVLPAISIPASMKRVNSPLEKCRATGEGQHPLVSDDEWLDRITGVGVIFKTRAMLQLFRDLNSLFSVYSCK